VSTKAYIEHIEGLNYGAPTSTFLALLTQVSASCLLYSSSHPRLFFSFLMKYPSGNIKCYGGAPNFNIIG